MIFMLRNSQPGVFFKTSENFYKIHFRISVAELRFWIVYYHAKVVLSNKRLLTWGVLLYIFLYRRSQDTPVYFKMTLTNDFNKWLFSVSCQTVYCFLLNISSQFLVWGEFMNLVSRLNFFKTFFRRYLNYCSMVLL